MKLCAICKLPRPINRKDSYCQDCRKIINAKRNSLEAKQARSNRYYWLVKVPKFKAKMNKEHAYAGRKPGTYTPLPLTGPDNEGWQGIAFSRNKGHEDEE